MVSLIKKAKDKLKDELSNGRVFYRNQCIEYCFFSSSKPQTLIGKSSPSSLAVESLTGDAGNVRFFIKELASFSLQSFLVRHRILEFDVTFTVCDKVVSIQWL